jgi:hypothetical protein
VSLIGDFRETLVTLAVRRAGIDKRPKCSQKMQKNIGRYERMVGQRMGCLLFKLEVLNMLVANFWHVPSQYCGDATSYGFKLGNNVETTYS